MALKLARSIPWAMTKRGASMSIDLTIGLTNRPGTLAAASEILGRSGINIEGACGYICAGDERGEYHVLVADAERAKRALIDAGFDVLAERRVVVTPIENRPGAAAGLLRQIAQAGANVELLYLTADGRLVVGGSDVKAIEQALG